MAFFTRLVNIIYQQKIFRNRHGHEAGGATSKLHLKLRLIAVLIMLAIALLGVIVIVFKPIIAYYYWQYSAIAFVIINITLSWHAATKHRHLALVAQELVHWLSLMTALLIVSFFYRLGITTDFVASTFILLTLALGTFLAGIYFDPLLLLVGIILALLSILAAIAIKYTLAIVVFIIIINFILISVKLRRSFKKS